MNPRSAHRLFLVFVAVILLAPLAAPYDPMRTETANTLQAPSAAHWFGTDALGRDVLSRALYGGQHTILIAGAATLIAVLPGVLLGLLSAVGWLERPIAVMTNAVLAFPGLLLALLVITLMGQGAFQLALATGLTQVAPCARVTRAVVKVVLAQGFVEAAKGLGAGQGRIIFRYVLPNAIGTVLAYTAVVFVYAILNSAALSFLGLGGEPGIPDWGVMLAEGRQAFRLAPWVAAAPGLAITLTVLLGNRAADAMANLRR